MIEHFNHENENDLADFIASQMQKEGLNNEQNLDSKLNTKIM